MPKVRTTVVNGIFDKDRIAMEWRAERPYRRAASPPQNGRSLPQPVAYVLMLLMQSEGLR